MSEVLWIMSVTLVFIVVAIIIDRKQKKSGVMHEGKLLKSEVVCREGEKFYVEKVVCKDWHASIHSYYLVSERLIGGHTIVEQRWNYNDFCDITVRLNDCTFALNRQVEVIALVRSFRPIPIEEFDRIARPLIM